MPYMPRLLAMIFSVTLMHGLALPTNPLWPTLARGLAASSGSDGKSHP